MNTGPCPEIFQLSIPAISYFANRRFKIILIARQSSRCCACSTYGRNKKYEQDYNLKIWEKGTLVRTKLWSEDTINFDSKDQIYNDEN